MSEEQESIKLLNQFRNAYYNDQGYMKDLANAINYILPKYIKLKGKPSKKENVFLTSLLKLNKLYKEMNNLLCLIYLSDSFDGKQRERFTELNTEIARLEKKCVKN